MESPRNRVHRSSRAKCLLRALRSRTSRLSILFLSPRVLVNSESMCQKSSCEKFSRDYCAFLTLLRWSGAFPGVSVGICCKKKDVESRISSSRLHGFAFLPDLIFVYVRRSIAILYGSLRWSETCRKDGCILEATRVSPPS